MKKVYLSGAISGIAKEVYEAAFNEAADFFEEKGFAVVNPVTLDHVENATWEDYMKRDIKALLDCDYIYMLEGWSRSKGARIELNLASELGISRIDIYPNRDIITY